MNTGKVDWIPNLLEYRNWRKLDNFSNKSLLLDDRSHVFLNVQRLEDKVYLTKIGDEYLSNVMREAEKEEADRKAEKFGPDLGSDELPF